MAENRPIDPTDAEEVTAPTGFAAGNHVDAMLNGMRARAEADAAARTSADDDSHRAAQDALQSEFEKFLEAYKRALGTSISQSHYDAALADGTLEKVSNTVTVTGGIDGYAEFTTKDGSSKYHITPEGVFHDDANTNVSPEEAYNSAILVSNLAKAHSEGVTISGNDQQKYMYFLGLQEVNKSLTPPLTLNNEAEILAIDPSIKAQAVQQFNAFKAQQAVELDLTEAEEEVEDKLHVEGTVNAEFGEEWTTGVEIEEPQVRAINDPLLPDDVIALRDIDGNLQMFTTDPAAREEVTPLSADDRAKLIQNTDTAKGIVPTSLYEDLTSHVKETGVATNKSIRSFLEEQGVPPEHISKVTKDAISRINKEDFINVVPQGAAYRRVVNIQEDFTQAAAPQAKLPTLKLTNEHGITPEDDTVARIAADILGGHSTLKDAIDADTFNFGTTKEVAELSPSGQKLYDDFKAFASEPPDVQNIFKDPAADTRSQMLDFLKERGVPESEARRTLGDFAIRMGEEGLLSDSAETTIINEPLDAGVRRILAKMPPPSA